jgi:dTDP-4-amino-4,6-dideoxygalactose transaminase
MTAPRIPFLRPRPARLSRMVAELEAIEASGIFSNHGPVSRRFEASLTERWFGGRGGSLAVNNATIGLMLAIRDAAMPGPRRRYALMPSFTFAATAHAAIWAGLTPLLCDIDERTWAADAAAEDELLRRHADEIACVVPHACFGNAIDLERYARLASELGVGVVVDAAAGLGSTGAAGDPFGAGFRHAIVYSMHATKTFATAEGGVIHTGDPDRLARLRAMSDFGFGEARSATMPGLNAKLSEIGALLALAKLDDLDRVVEHRGRLVECYRDALDGFGFQQPTGTRQAHQFAAVVLPQGLGERRAEIAARLEARGIGTRHYFSPHLAQQPYFGEVCETGPLDVTDRVASHILSLPLSDEMTPEEVEVVAAALLSVVQEVA